MLQRVCPRHPENAFSWIAEGEIVSASHLYILMHADEGIPARLCEHVFRYGLHCILVERRTCYWLMCVRDWRLTRKASSGVQAFFASPLIEESCSETFSMVSASISTRSCVLRMTANERSKVICCAAGKELPAFNGIISSWLRLHAKKSYLVKRVEDLHLLLSKLAALCQHGNDFRTNCRSGNGLGG